MRRIGILAFAALISAATAAPAQEFPTQLVKFVVPAAPGSTTDTLARVVADALARKWGKPTVVENIAGGGMNIGATAVARAAPDGHMLLVAPPAPLTISHLLAKDLNYSPQAFVPVTLLAKISNVLVARKTLPANSVKELIDYAKANPGKLNFSTAGTGGAAHIAMAAFNVASGTTMTHVPYRGTPQSVGDVISGQVQLTFTSGVSLLPHVRAGTLRAVAITATGMPRRWYSATRAMKLKAEHLRALEQFIARAVVGAPALEHAIPALTPRALTLAS
jgi:tripartite-type tricarboxylate transporter receptor subunit TctC